VAGGDLAHITCQCTYAQSARLSLTAVYEPLLGWPSAARCRSSVQDEGGGQGLRIAPAGGMEGRSISSRAAGCQLAARQPHQLTTRQAVAIPCCPTCMHACMRAAGHTLLHSCTIQLRACCKRSDIVLVSATVPWQLWGVDCRSVYVPHQRCLVLSVKDLS
jgi:hypothetical protein